jgi:hypothetical protein
VTTSPPKRGSQSDRRPDRRRPLQSAPGGGLILAAGLDLERTDVLSRARRRLEAQPTN